jgi:hypothetical protein
MFCISMISISSKKCYKQYFYLTMLMWQSQPTFEFFLLLLLTITNPKVGWDCHVIVVG